MATTVPVIAPSIPVPDGTPQSHQQSLMAIIQEHQLARPAGKLNTDPSDAAKQIATAIDQVS
jgi:hypothetical protein